MYENFSETIDLKIDTGKRSFQGSRLICIRRHCCLNNCLQNWPHKQYLEQYLQIEVFKSKVNRSYSCSLTLCHCGPGYTLLLDTKENHVSVIEGGELAIWGDASLRWETVLFLRRCQGKAERKGCNLVSFPPP